MEPTPILPFVFAEPINTERLTLRLMTDADVDDVFAYQSLENVCRYLLFAPRSHEEVAERVARFAAATTLAADGDYLQLALELPGENGARARVIGDSYFTLADVGNAHGEIGWTMHPDFMGKGYASEAASAVLDIAFTTMNLHRVSANIDPRNHASAALCRRLGMREEAHFLSDLWSKGEWTDSGIYAILAAEWRASRVR